MAFLKIMLIVLASGLASNECAFVDTLNKCYVKDKDCIKNLIQDVIRKIPKNEGIPELGIKSIDPAELKNVEVSIPNILTLKLMEGEATGISKSTINSFDINLEKSLVSVEVICDLVVTGKYNVFSDSPVFKSLFNGKSISGDGTGKLKIDKVKVNFEFFVDVKKRDGEYYFNCDFKKIKYTYDVLGKVEVEADHLMLGGKESSKEVVALINQNWKILVGAFGNSIFGEALKVVYGFLHKFFVNVPVKTYLLDDFSQYVD